MTYIYTRNKEQILINQSKPGHKTKHDMEILITFIIVLAATATAVLTKTTNGATNATLKH